eukprot:2783381-Heterocapsa_arctica.AAC.1
MDECRHKGKPKGCSYAHEQSEIDEVNARRKGFVRSRLAQKGWPCLKHNELNMFELNGTLICGPAHDEWVREAAIAAGHKGEPLLG